MRVRSIAAPLGCATALACCVAGCFDFQRLGDADLAPADGGLDAGVCLAPADCGDGRNCIDGECRPAPLDCAALAAAHPELPDGTYFIASGTLHRAYCDMRLAAALCEEGPPAPHTGRTRDASATPYEMTSTLISPDTCELWGLRGSDGHPFAAFVRMTGADFSPCQVLGFLSDHELPGCPYGKNTGTCGYTNDSFLIWGNRCSGCDMNSGSFPKYVVMGPVFNGAVLSSAARSTVARCHTVAGVD
jgi:hypothetical protein